MVQNGSRPYARSDTFILWYEAVSKDIFVVFGRTRIDGRRDDVRHANLSNRADGEPFRAEHP